MAEEYGFAEGLKSITQSLIDVGNARRDVKAAWNDSSAAQQRDASDQPKTKTDKTLLYVGLAVAVLYLIKKRG